LLTVRGAIETYINMRDARDTARKGREVRSNASGRLSLYVTGREIAGAGKSVSTAALADIAMHNLTEGDLLKWRAALPHEMKSTTKKRLINDLKAALNAAYTDNRSKLPTTLPATIKHGLRMVDDGGEAEPFARENQILTDAQVAAIIGAARKVDEEQGWEGDLFRLVVVLAATGARFSQVIRLQVRDLQRDQARIVMPGSRKGRGAKGSTPIPIGADVLKALLPAVAGRPNDAPLLERWRSKQIAGSIRWERCGRSAWQYSELNRPWPAIRARAKLPHVIPYALRHSSIVRGIKHLPIRLVAALHDTSVAMIERHYGRWIADGLDELAARAVVPLIPAGETENVVQLAVGR
jgi:integrase